MGGLRISYLARRVGVPVSTVRYYERVGVMPEPRRTDSGYRVYDDDAEARLLFVSRAKRFGLGLEEITELAGAWDDTNCGATRERLGALLVAKRAEIAEQVRELECFSRQLGGAGAISGRRWSRGVCSRPRVLHTRASDTPVTLGERPTPVSVPVACTLDVALARTFSALADPVRLRLYSLIAEAGEICSCDMLQSLRKAQPTISPHTKILAEAGLIAGEKRGRWVWWHIVPERLATVRDALAV